MEFERAIFRVYERCMESLRDDGEDGLENINIKTCKAIELFALIGGLLLLLSLLYLHCVFVGSSGCLPHQLSNFDVVYVSNQTFKNASVFSSSKTFQLGSDELLSITVDRFSMEAAKPTKNIRTSKSNDDTMGNSVAKNNQARIQILDSNTTHKNESTSSSENNDLYPSLRYDYLFAFNPYVLLLPDNVKKSHKFRSVNVTFGSQCFGGAFTQSLLTLAGTDAVVLNNVMFTFKRSGYMLVGASEDLYRWTDEDVDPYYLDRLKPTEAARRYAMVGTWLRRKVNVLVVSLFSFFLMSSVTALLVRMLISSGVVLLFPIFWLFQMMGMHAINLRIISLSYPWIGLPMEILRSRNLSATPFILGHISRVVIYYCLYAAAQLAFSTWFYDKDSPSQQELWLCAVMMLWEYYSMIYVRASGSIQLFPRASLALFLIYHFYYFSFPSGLHLLALSTMSLLLFYLMVHCVRVFEAKSFQMGFISIDQPRFVCKSRVFFLNIWIYIYLYKFVHIDSDCVYEWPVTHCILFSFFLLK